MALNPYGKSNDGPRITVNALLKNPRTIPGRVLRMLDQQFITDSVLRNAGGTPSGAVVYEESAPQFAEHEASVVQEGSEYPTTRGLVGERKVVRTVKRGLALEVTEEMRMRNDIDAVNRSLTQVRNTIVRQHEDLFLKLFAEHASVQTMPASGLWDVNATRVRDDLADAMYMVREAAVEGRADDFLGYEPDTLIVSNLTATDLLKSDDIAKVYQGNIADETPGYVGAMPGRFFGLRILKSRRMSKIMPEKAILLNSRIVGGLVDERPLRATPMEQDRKREVWWSNVSRISTMFLDNPKAAVIITGVNNEVV